MKRQVMLVITIIALLVCPGCKISADDPSVGKGQVFQGELQVRIADDFKGQASKTQYLLISAADGERLRLYFPKGPPEPAMVSGTRVEIRGWRHDGRLEVQTLRVLTD